ncbi:MAG: BON domain-containing protein, partial [Bacteroidota bacterium]
MSEQAVGRWLLAVVAVVTSLLLPPAVAAQAVDDRLADLRTTARVEQALGGHDELRAFDYALRVEAGVLTLGGALPSEVLRQEALALASATRGVGQVIDSLIVPVDSTLVADPVVVADASPDLAAPDT